MENKARRVFWYINRYFMVPMFRMGMGAFMGNPYSSYIMVLKTTGHKTGKTRYTPVNYAIHDGCVYCMAGFGAGAHWYRNLQANPELEVIMPGGTISGVAEEVTDPQEQALVLRMVLKNAGFAGFFLGFNPRTISDEEFIERMKDDKLVRIRPTGLKGGPSDPGGRMWIMLTVSTLLLWVFLRRKRK